MTNLITNIYTACQNLAQHISEQGYHVEGSSVFSIEDIELKMDQNSLTGSFSDSANNTIHITICLNTGFRESNIDEIIESVYESKSNDDVLIIVVKDNINENFQETVNKKLMYEWEKERRLVIVQTLQRLQVNILKHEIVPRHSILDAKKVEELKARYNISADEQFPEISRFDPVAKAIFIKPGQVCQIDRPSKTSILSPYFRRCLNT